MRIHILSGPPTPTQVGEMLEPHVTFVKGAVDTRNRVVAGGGEMHADCEAALLEAGSVQDDIWGADWLPGTHEVRFKSFIDILPRLGNRSMTFQDPELKRTVEEIVREVFEP